MVNIERLHIGQAVIYGGRVWHVCALSVLLDEPVMHLLPPDGDWDDVVEVFKDELNDVTPVKYTTDV